MYTGLQLVDVPKEPDPERGWTQSAVQLALYENDIKKELSNIDQSFLYIGMKLHDIKVGDLYSISHEIEPGWYVAYKSVIEYAVDVFDFSASTASNLLNVYERFADSRGFLLPEWQGYTFSQLCELLRFPYIDDYIKGQISPFMTCRQIRALNPKNAKSEVVQTLPPSKENKEEEKFAPRFDVKNEEVSKPQEVQEPHDDMVVKVIEDVNSLRDWYFDKNYSFPMTIWYKK